MKAQINMSARKVASASTSKCSYANKGLPSCFRVNDAGRSKSKRPDAKNDCTVRSVALATGLAYDDAYDFLASAGRRAGCGFAFLDWAKSDPLINGQRLIWHPFPTEKGTRRINAAQFAHDHPTGRYIIAIASHVISCVEGLLLDTVCPRPRQFIRGAWEVVPDNPEMKDVPYQQDLGTLAEIVESPTSVAADKPTRPVQLKLFTLKPD